MQILKTSVDAKHCGNAPVDFMYAVEHEVLLDDNSKIYVHIQIVPSGDKFYAVNTTSLFSKSGQFAEPIEMYENLKKASKSKYIKLFKELDKIINDKIDETMSEIDDTLYNGGIRFGAQVNSKGLNVYVEAAAHLSKEDKFIYLQINKVNGKNRYTITDVSIYLRMDMGELYKAYYGEKPEVPFIVDTEDLECLGEYSFLKNDFIDMDKMLVENFKDITK